MIPAFAQRIQSAKPSFVREILKAVANPNLISFAGGLPHPDSFPFEALASTSQAIFAEKDTGVFQYNITEGDKDLRDYLAARYNDKFGLAIDAENILITTGSQQALDLITKVFIDPNDRVVIDATMLGKCAAPPAPAMMTCKPRSAAVCA